MLPAFDGLTAACAMIHSVRVKFENGAAIFLCKVIHRLDACVT
jgi:hypothetical protein